MLNWKPFVASDYKPLPEGHVHSRYTKKKNYLLYIPDENGHYSITHANQHTIRLFTTPIRGGEWKDSPTFVAEIELPSGEIDRLNKERNAHFEKVKAACLNEDEWLRDVRDSEFSDLVISRGS